ncbi:imidazole glycerol phosphate synthase subunit HisH [Thermodesulfobacteriota bacterium]
MIAIVDYGMGNLGSIHNMFKKIGAPSIITASISDIEQADKLILPGVGAYDTGMDQLKKRYLIPILEHKVNVLKTPILGICLGMQLLTQKGEEGDLPGLGWLNAKTIRFRFNNDSKKLKVPHMGWNTVRVARASPLFRNMYAESRFYFVHSFYVQCICEETVLTYTHYGLDFASAVQKDNIFGVQFHPEKSHKFGMKLLENYAGM